MGETEKKEFKVNYGSTKVLKMIFTVNGGGTMTWNLKYPKDTLTKVQVATLADEMLTDGLILYKDNEAIALKDTYIYETATIEIPS